MSTTGVQTSDWFASNAPQQQAQGPQQAQGADWFEQNAQKPKQYAPGRQFGMDVARGMGLDADRIAAAEDSGGQGEALKEIGSQVLNGLKGLVKDPLLPITGTASNFEQAVKSGSPGQIVGALSSILGGAESTEGKGALSRAYNAPGDYLSAARDTAANGLRDETGNLRPGVKRVSQGVGALAGHVTGIPGGELAGFSMGPSLADALIPGREPSVAKAVPIQQSPYWDPAAYKAGRQGAVQSNPFPQSSSASARPSLIQDPNSPAPAINRTYVSYDRGLLVQLARSGDLNALRELIRNPGNINVREAVPNSRYLLEQGSPASIYGGPGYKLSDLARGQ